jgi:enoyl-CoA hydratase
VRGVVVTGGTEYFSAGADLNDALAIAGAADGLAYFKRWHALCDVFETLSKPVIAAIEGAAVAGGLELALWCDLRVAARSAFLGVFNRRFGAPLIDLGTLRLPRLIGQGRAADMILTGRAVAAEEALAWGLVNRVTEEGGALAEALGLAARIAAFPQAALRIDRLSALEQWGLDQEAAAAAEARRARPAIEEALRGAARFAAGAGRHGAGVE